MTTPTRIEKRAMRGEVKFKVRQNALLLKEFTAQQIVDATGLNRSSVNTELQRMKREEFLVKPVGRSTYSLTSDIARILELTRNVQAFYSEPRTAASQSSVSSGGMSPRSRHYFIAQELLDELPSMQGEERLQAISQIERALRRAEAAEGGTSVPESITRYLQLQRVRLDLLRDVTPPEGSIQQLIDLQEFFIRNDDTQALEVIKNLLLTATPTGVAVAAIEKAQSTLQPIIGIFNTLQLNNPILTVTGRILEITLEKSAAILLEKSAAIPFEDKTPRDKEEETDIPVKKALQRLETKEAYNALYVVEYTLKRRPGGIRSSSKQALDTIKQELLFSGPGKKRRKTAPRRSSGRRISREPSSKRIRLSLSYSRIPRVKGSSSPEAELAHSIFHEVNSAVLETET